VSLFVYEIFRFLLLVIFLFFVPLDGGFGGGSSGNGTFIPYSVYLSSNALFPLMALFVLLKPREYRNYLNLYVAGKVIGVISFYVWEFFSRMRLRPASFDFVNGYEALPWAGNIAVVFLLFGSIFLISFADILSIWGAWTVKNKFRQTVDDVPVYGGT